MIKYFIKKQKITLIFFIMCLMLGVYNFVQLPKQEMPDITPLTANVTTVYPGASPEKVEQTVTKILEQSIRGIQEIKSVSSTSSKGMSSINVEVFDNVEPTPVWEELRRKVQDVQAELPDDVIQSVVNDSMTSSFVGSYAIISNNNMDELYGLHSMMSTWQDQLKTVTGVAKVNIQGIPEQEIQINLNTQKLQQYGLSWETVMQAIQNENDRIPTGSLDYNERSYQITVPASTEPTVLNNIQVTSTQEGYPVYLKDIGSAELKFKKADYLTYVDNKPALSISISGAAGADIPSVTKAVDSKIHELAQSLPKDVEFRLLFAQNDRVSELFLNLTKEMLIAIAAVIVICMLGLNMLTSAFVALAIPVSIAVGFIILPKMGITLNQISIIGLIIVLGILVDDAVVVNDNIERRLTELSESPSEAAVNGTKEVSLSILTATLATVAAFAPLLFLPGEIGDFIQPIPTVISLTMLASMVMSLTIIPIFRQWYDKRRRKDRSRPLKPPGLLGKQIQQINNVYSHKWMPRVLQKPLFTALTGLVISTLAYGLIAFVPIQLFPESDQPDATISVTMPEGTSLQETDRVIREITAWVVQQPESEHVASASGGAAPQMYSDIAGGSGDQGPLNGQIAIAGKEGVFQGEETVNKWSAFLKTTYPGAKIKIRIPELGIPVGSAVSVRIKGDDLAELQNVATQVKTLVAGTEGTANISDDMGMQSYNLTFKINEQALNKYQVSYANLTRTLLLMGDGIKVSTFDTGNELIDIKLYMDQHSGDPNALFQQLSVTNSKGQQIPLSHLTDMNSGFSIQQIHRHNLERAITVTADGEGRTASELTEEIRSKLENTSLTPGYTWELGGETTAQSDIFANLGSLAVVVVFLIVILITMQFYSLTAPIIIMATVYLAAAGGIIGSFITGMPIGFMSIMGIISLAGIVVRNGIVLIEFIEEARREGADLKEAILMATMARFRPIILTSLTAIVGMVPIATIGEILFKPLATTIIFGLMFSTILTLFVVPSLYMVVAQWKLRRQQKNRDNSNLS
ncbi:efflux RND transporter permease subunit [Paenibacillus macerans]|uniref:efflux RND transporter permease subunit n=1 Tax=Paenibacillus macerans TaxID=44252 RepID=UPI00203E5449|nr:efflux RND transporter permease subunit [Paenibacillus macerans]MCM3701509.1 efflux RND transporter permease subunit [Paenibacillus macerans]